jgi:uncharacterized HTH-type transcriptional regulator HI_1476|nr:MAG TPA: Repressor protein CI [Caudoviricetes sp.]
MEIKCKKVNGLGDRIRNRREMLKLSRSSLSADLNVATSTLQAWELADREPPASDIVALASLLKTSTNYLLHGVDDTAQIERQPVKSIETEDDEFEFVVDCRDVVVTAGYGGVNGDYLDLKQTKVEKAWLAAHDLKAEDCGMYKVTGDSMAETLRDKDDIIVHHPSKQLTDGKIFVLNNNGSVLVKRVQVTFKGVTLISDNKDYKPIELTQDESDELIVIGQVVRGYRDF